MSPHHHLLYRFVTILTSFLVLPCYLNCLSSHTVETIFPPCTINPRLLWQQNLLKVCCGRGGFFKQTTLTLNVRFHCSYRPMDIAHTENLSLVTTFFSIFSISSHLFISLLPRKCHLMPSLVCHAESSRSPSSWSCFYIHFASCCKGIAYLLIIYLYLASFHKGFVVLQDHLQ